MRTIKSPKADLESKRFIFEEIGVIIALGLILWAFELGTFEIQNLDLSLRINSDIPEEIIEITEQTKTPPPPTPPQQTTIIEIVENDSDIDHEIEIDVEANQYTEVEKYISIEIQEEVEMEEEDTQIFTVVESMPEFPGGNAALVTYLSENIKYPRMALESGIQGKVFVTFIIEKNGHISDVKVLRGIGGGCDEEAIRVVLNMPQWKPGLQRCMPVRVKFNLPVRFILR